MNKREIKHMKKYLKENKEDYERIVIKNGFAGDSLTYEMYYQQVLSIVKYIGKLQQENRQLKERIDKTIKYIEYNDECLYTFEPDYDYEENIVDNYEPSNYREDLLEILKGDSNDKRR